MEVLKKIENVLKTKDCNILNKREDFQKSFEIIKNHINSIENDVLINFCESDIKTIKRSIRICKSFILEAYLDKKETEFIKDWIYLVFNWNQNTLKDNDLNVSMQYLLRIMDQHYTIIEAIDHLKFLLDRSKKIQGWQPPSFELSKHYLKFLEE